MYFNSVEFTDFPPFAKGSRMECQPVPDKPEDLAEVHLITGENGTGKTRLLCLLAASLGEVEPLLKRSGENLLSFNLGMRFDVKLSRAPVMRLSLCNYQLEPEDPDSEVLTKMGALTPAISRRGVTYLSDAVEPIKGAYQKSMKDNRLHFAPTESYSSGFLARLQQIVVSARLHESARMMDLAGRMEKVLSEIFGTSFVFTPKTYPVEEMWVKCDSLGGGGALPLSSCPDGLLSLLGWIVDCAMAMEEFAANWEETLFSLKAHERYLNLHTGSTHGPGYRFWTSVLNEFSNKFPLQAGYAAEAHFSGIEGSVFAIEFPESQKLAALSLGRPGMRKALESIIQAQTSSSIQLDIRVVKDTPPSPADIPGDREIIPNTESHWSAFDIPCIILLDEIETHLHPSWQWKVLPAFQKMFPKAQIFVATHSPFVIASLNKGMIHRLRRGPDGVVDDPRPASEGDSYESALEDIQEVKQRFDPTSEALLDGFYKQRKAALAGDPDAARKARELVKEIARRSSELEDIIGRESRQMERQLKELTSK